MRYFKYLALLAVLALPAVHSQAQVAIAVQIGPNYGLYNAPPVCPYGFYPDYPFDCAPYGYWGPEWFVDGVFIGAGPWYRFYYVHPEFYRRYYYVGRFERFHDREFREHRWFRADDDRRFRDRDHWYRGGDREFRDRGFRGVDRGFREGDRSFRGGGNEFRGWDRGFHGGHDRGSGRGHGNGHDRGRHEGHR